MGEQIVEMLRAHQSLSRREARERAIALLDMVRIAAAEDRFSAYPHELSGGMRQRVAIAMALANNPDIIIADEPTTALDVTVQAQILTLLRDLAERRGTALLFISHDFGVISELCDRVAVMYAGRVVETGLTERILSRPAHPYTRRLIDCVPVPGQPRPSFEAIDGLPPPPDRLPPGCAFAARCQRVEARCRGGDIALLPLDGDGSVRCIRPLDYGI